jgi:hypothetical protein
MKKRDPKLDKTERICVRLTAKEKQKLREKAAKANSSLGGYIRLCIDQEVVTYGAYKQVYDLLYEVNRIGNNVNQIAHNANCGYYSKKDADRMLANQKDLKATVEQLAERLHILPGSDPE